MTAETWQETEARITASLDALVATFPPRSPEEQERWAQIDRQVLALPDWQMLRAEMRRAGEGW